MLMLITRRPWFYILGFIFILLIIKSWIGDLTEMRKLLRQQNGKSERSNILFYFEKNFQKFIRFSFSIIECIYPSEDLKPFIEFFSLQNQKFIKLIMQICKIFCNFGP